MRYIPLTLSLVALSLLITGCGFQPVYGDKKHATVTQGERDSPVLVAFDKTRISMIPNREGQILRNELIKRFYRDGYPSDPLYQLNISPISIVNLDLDLTKASDTTRAQLRVTSSLTLVNIQNGDILLSRPLFAITSYNILGSEFTNRVAEQAARENALRDMARQAETQLGIYFRNPEISKAPVTNDPYGRTFIE